jgi:hypothetical protein
MRCLRFLLLAVTGALLFTSKLIAQGAEIAPRISVPVDENLLVTLQGNVPWMAKAEFDRGEAAPSTQMLHVRLALSRSSEQQAAMGKYEAELQDKSSPNYHKWLTPEQFGKLYGPADADIAVIVAWLESHGLEVDPVAPGRIDISFSGSVPQIEEVLHTSIHTYRANGEEFLSNSINPAIPAALARVISGVSHLNTIKPKPEHTRAQMGMFDQGAGKMKAVSPGQGPRPELTHGGGTAASPYQLFIVAGDAATIYDTPNTFNANVTVSGTSYTGAGVTIGIGGDAVITPGIVANYRSRFVGDTAQPTITNVDGVTSTGDSDEAYLDNEIAGGLAPGAAIHFYTATSLDTAIQQMVNDNTVDIISISFGNCEFAFTTVDNQLFSSWWQQAAMQGIAVVVATGDSGSAGCDNPNSVTVASGGLAVNALGSTPYNIAVGGTDFSGLAAASSFSTYVSTSSSSANLYRTALKYIPESTWNDSTTVNGTLSNNVPAAAASIVAGSGGKSSCSTNTNLGAGGTCTSGYAKPFWQRGTNVPADGVRDLPDVVLMAGVQTDHAGWLVCDSDTGIVGSITITADCSTQTDGHFYFFPFGGTSAATPAFAGMLALVEEKTGGRLGLAAKELYDLYNGSHASAIFHDITSGNISVPCASGSPNCATNAAGNLFLTGYNASTGYDLATGMGSIDATQLITYWGTAIGNQSTTVSVQPSPSTIAQSAPMTVVVSVKGSSTVGNPTGTLTLSGGGYTSPAQTLTASGTDSGTYTFSVPGSSFTQGTDTLTVSYSGDVDYATQTGTATVTVNSLSATVTVTPSATTITTTTPLSVAVTVASTGPPPTGTVTLSGGGYNSPAQTLSSGSYTFIVAAGAFAKGADTLTVTYSGDSNYGSATQTTTVTVNGIAASVSVTPSATTIVTSQPLTVTGSVTGAGATPTGTITLAGEGFTSAAQMLPSSGTYSINIPANSLSAGTDTLTVTYSGDAVYASATGSASVKVNTPLTSTLTVVPSATTINVNQSLDVSATVMGSGGTPTGTVTLAGGGYTSVAATLASGSFKFTIPGGSLAKGADTLTVTYSGDPAYGPATGTTSVTVNLLTAAVSVTPSMLTVGTAQTLSVAAVVAGAASAPTGAVKLSGGGYTSASQSLTGGAFTFAVPAGILTVGTDTLTVTYSGDSTYNASTGTAAVTVVHSTFSLAANPNALTLTAGASSGNTTTIGVTPVAGYVGTVTLSATVTAAPSGAVSTPTVSFNPGSIAFTGATNTTQTATATVATTVASVVRGGQGFAWFKAAGGTALAALLFLFAPVGSRRGRRMLSALLMVTAAGFTIAGCGGGGGGGGGTNKITPGVTVSPSKNAISAADPLSVAISVSGGTTAATGSVTLSGGGYTSGATSLSSGAATINIPANGLSVGSDTLTATYSGDSNYNPATGTSTVTVNKPGTTTGAYTITVTGTGNDAAHITATTTITLTLQ